MKGITFFSLRASRGLIGTKNVFFRRLEMMSSVSFDHYSSLGSADRSLLVQITRIGYSNIRVFAKNNVGGTRTYIKEIPKTKVSETHVKTIYQLLHDYVIIITACYTHMRCFK